MAWGARCTMVIVAVLASSGCIAAHSDSGNLRSAHNISGSVQRDQKRKETIDTSRGEEDDQEQKTPIDVDVRGRPSPNLQDKGIVIATEKLIILDDDQAVVSKHAHPDVVGGIIPKITKIVMSWFMPSSKKSEDTQTCEERQKQGADAWVYELMPGVPVKIWHVLVWIHSALVDGLFPFISEKWNFCVTTLRHVCSGAWESARWVFPKDATPWSVVRFGFSTMLLAVCAGGFISRSPELAQFAGRCALFSCFMLTLFVMCFVLEFLWLVKMEIPQLLMASIAVALSIVAAIIVFLIFLVVCVVLFLVMYVCSIIFPYMAENKIANVDNIIGFCYRDGRHHEIAFSKIMLAKSMVDVVQSLLGICGPSDEPSISTSQRVGHVWGQIIDLQSVYYMASSVFAIHSTCLGVMFYYVLLMQGVYVFALVGLIGHPVADFEFAKQFFTKVQDVPQLILILFIFKYNPDHPDQYAYYEAASSVCSIFTTCATSLLSSGTPGGYTAAKST